MNVTRSSEPVNTRDGQLLYGMYNYDYHGRVEQGISITPLLTT